jgi:hypothetical protein
MTEINLGTLKMPINSATKTFALLAKRGAGKTYAGAVMAEEFYKSNIPFVVFDPIDVWWGLKFKKTGEDEEGNPILEKGLPVVVFGIEHADIKIDREMGRKIAQAVVKYNISAVISTFGMPKVAQRHLIAEFSDELLNINNTPRHIFIEEAHEYVPQKVMGGLGVCFNNVSNLVVMGRNRGIGVTLLNQRAATLNKDVLTQIDNLIALRSVGPQDRKSLKEWVEAHLPCQGDFEKFINDLPALPTGTAWIWSPEFLGIFEKIKIRERETYHPDREKIGTNFVMPNFEQTDIQEFINEFSMELEENPVEKLSHIPQMQKKGSARSPEGLSVRAGFEEEKKKWEMDLIKIKNDYETKLMQKDIELRRQTDLLNQLRKLLGVTELTLQSKPMLATSQVELWLSKLGNGMPSNILKFLTNKSGLKFTRSQIALATGYSANGGSFSNALSLLRKNLLIKQEGDLIFANPDL